MRSLWREDEARGLGGIDLLVYRSRLLGRDESLVLWGGGNTSLKHQEIDFRGGPVPVLRIKGSGADLRTITAADFPGLRLDDLLPLQLRDAMDDEAMVSWLGHCQMEPGSRRPSIETLLHAFVPHPHVDHTHADAILALADVEEGKHHVEAALGADAAWVPYRRPGFRLSKDVGEAVRAAPRARCVVLERHGLIAWGATAREAYETTLEMVTRAEEYARGRASGRKGLGSIRIPALPAAERRAAAVTILPRLRGLLSRIAPEARQVLRFDDSDEVLDFIGREAAPALSQEGPATPDHLMYAGLRPAIAAIDPQALASGGAGARIAAALESALREHVLWHAAWVNENRGREEPPFDPRPRVVLVPGIGMVTAWKDARHARLAADVARHAMAVMRAASGLGVYRTLSPKEAYDIETWPLERHRMSLAPPEAELQRRVALVTGAARGIGRAAALRLAAAGCQVVVTDRDGEGAGAVAAAIAAAHGPESAVGIALDVTDEASVQAGFDAAALAYGGLDIVVSNAGIAHVSPIERLEKRDWDRSLAVNATGHFLVSRAAVRLLKEQGLGGSLVVVGTKNVLAPGKDFGAYSASKAAQVQLARVLAIEAGADGVRVNLVHPDAVFQDSGLWSEEIRAERARAHGIGVGELEDFYRRRNLLGLKVTPEDVAEAVLWLASERSSRTTGCIVTVDGGVREAFPR
jgi:rhamnulose-1-phosphate aldolase/alcohol dehydrogenase